MEREDLEDHQQALEELDPWKRELLDSEALVHVVEIENVGGLIMPMELTLNFVDGESETHQLAPQLWTRAREKVRMYFLDERELTHVEIDSNDLYRDQNRSDNRFPPEIEIRRFRLKESEKDENPMQDALKKEEEAAETKESEEEPDEEVE